MRAWILSDLHCDHGTIPPPVPDDADIALIAGDVCNDSWLLEVADRMPVIFVAGNHEFYRSSVTERLGQLRDMTKDQVWTLENAKYRFTDSSFDISRDRMIAGATLWTDFNGGNPDAMDHAHRCMNDYRYTEDFTPDDALGMHRESLQYLQNSGADVIITHHAPHPGSVHPRYEGQLLNYAYFSHALEKFDNPPRLWVHGHVHSCFDYMVGETRVICNPHGYPHERNNGFNPDLILEI